MILVKRLKFLPNLFLFQKGLDMMLMMLYIEKKSNFKTTKMSLYKIVKIFSFSKGLTDDFGQKVEFLPNLFLFQKGLDMTLMMF